jgi:histone acetyltransferase SAS3
MYAKLSSGAVTDAFLDTNRWRCTACINHNLEEDKESMTESITRQRLSSVPKLARDLLPSHRGGIEQGGHSMFNDLILPDDPMDGSRSLRKRKTSHEEEEEALPVRQTRKKRRSSELSKSAIGVDASLTAASPQAQDDDAMASGDDSDGAQHTASEHGSSRVRSTRSRLSAPQKKDKRLLAWIEDRQPNSLVVSFHLNNEKVQKIIAQKPKKKVMTVEQERQERRRERDRERRERNRKARELTRAQSQESTHYPAAQPITHAVPFYAFADKEVDENKSKPYGGILSEADADTSKTYPTPADRKRFDDARQKAEEDWKQKQEALYGNERPNKQAGPPSKIKCINFGGWEIDTWHAAPYPEEYSKNKVLYICEFCLKYMNSDYVAWRHKVRTSHIWCQMLY